ncbi:Imm40 family immunity protein [Desulfosporosinus sp. I2]|uniref:Imm40 family immunity protein n=1 Tax=Desulfosporosinus sp. I2 TaxID=1617025 RepID=UPI0005EF97D8|nr:Imm40 family immunity protein [Desulfosporosinus sp. I2]
MSISYKSCLPSDFPEELSKNAKSLEHLGISEIAWDWQNAIRIVGFLCECNCAVLGGDVYKMTNYELNSTYDSWYINKDETKTWSEYVAESKDKAVSYLNQYHDRNGDEFYYSVVFKENK